MGSFAENPGMSSDLVTSQWVERWRSRIQESSSLIIEGPLDVDEWLGLMFVIEHEDVSGIELLKLSIPRSARHAQAPKHIWEELYFSGMDSTGPSLVKGFGNALRKARFSSLKMLEIEVFSDLALAGLGMDSHSLGKIFMEGQFTNLRELHLSVSKPTSGYIGSFTESTAGRYTPEFVPVPRSTLDIYPSGVVSPTGSTCDIAHVLQTLGKGRKSIRWYSVGSA
ncbi:unnamed protein product [Calypogeia fissa]